MADDEDIETRGSRIDGDEKQNLYGSEGDYIRHEAITLTELNNMVRDAMGQCFPNVLWIVAEIASCNVTRNGHAYFELVDKGTEGVSAKSRAMCWADVYSVVSSEFRNATGSDIVPGIKIMMQCSVSFHSVYGYSLIISDLDVSYSLGDIAKKRMEIVRKLQEDGIIDSNKNLPFPSLPQRIAVISSLSAAGYGDFKDQLLSSPFKFEIKLFQATMQGNTTESSMIRSLDEINEHSDEFDVVTIIRGGGATSDLMSFDTYNLAFHVCNFPLPIITGIGHQRDESVLDLVANQHVKTPTAVAEFLIDVMCEKLDEVDSLTAHLRDVVAGQLNRVNLREYELRIKSAVGRRLESETLRLDAGQSKLKGAVSVFMERQNGELSLLSQQLKSASPLEILKRGYAIVSQNGRRVCKVADLNHAEKVKVSFADGEVKMSVYDE